MLVAGIDGTKGGWVAVELEDGRFSGAKLLRPIESDFGELGAAEVLGIDIPIVFGPRLADAQARAYLKGTASVVFSVPDRSKFGAPFSRGGGISAQAYALGPRIIHVTKLAVREKRLYEVHPEVSFRAMNGQKPLGFRKKSAGGVIERTKLLRRHGIKLGRLGDAALAPIDDVLDAAACAWTAHRIATRTVRSLPHPPQLVNGKSIAIWY
jgi:predicted RNase H-like nuclease